MKKRTPLLTCTVLAFAWLGFAQEAATPDAHQPSTPHSLQQDVISQESEKATSGQHLFAAQEPVAADLSPAVTEPNTLLPAARPTPDNQRAPPMGLLLFICVLAIFLGFELISKVPSQLHTPLMSGSNAISGITIVGALAVAGLDTGSAFSTLLGTLAVAFATLNVVGGYLVTDRMLGMFKKKDGGPQ